MGKIPEFTRTVLPQNAQYGLADAARQAGESKAAQFRQDAQNTERARQQGQAISGDINQIKYREAVADNTTWTNDAIVQFKRDAIDRLDPMRQSRSENPKDFHKDFDKTLSEMQSAALKAAPSEAARIAMRQSTNEIKVGYYDQNKEWETKRNIEGFGERLDRTADNLNTLAYRAGAEGVDLDQTGYMNDVEASVVAGSTVVAPDKLDAMQRTMSKGLVSNYMEGLFEKNPAKAKAILNSKRYDEILGAEEIQKFDSKIKAQERVELSDTIEEVNTATKLGLAVPKERLITLATNLEGAGMQAQAKNVREYAAIQDDVVAYAKKPLTNQVSELQTLKASVEAGNLGDAKKYAAMADVLQTKQAAIKSDPWSFYASRKVVADPNPIDFANAQAMGDEIKKRRLAVQQVQDLDGITMPMFTGAELDGLKKVFETSSAEQVATLMTSLTSTMKPNEQAALATAMSTKSGPIAVAMATGDAQVGEKILMGAQIDGSVTKPDFQASLTEKLNGVVTDPIRYEKIQDAIYSYYKVLQFQNKDTSKSVNSTLMEQAIQDVMGPVVSIDTYNGWGGQSTVLSYRDTTTGQYVENSVLQDTLSSLDDDRIKALNNGQLPVGTSGAKFTAKDIYKTGRFVSNGDGIYAVIDELGETVSNEDGTTFQIDARKLSTMASGNPVSPTVKTEPQVQVVTPEATIVTQPTQQKVEEPPPLQPGDYAEPTKEEVQGMINEATPDGVKKTGVKEMQPVIVKLIKSGVRKEDISAAIKGYYEQFNTESKPNADGRGAVIHKGGLGSFAELKKVLENLQPVQVASK